MAPGLFGGTLAAASQVADTVCPDTGSSSTRVLGGAATSRASLPPASADIGGARRQPRLPPANADNRAATARYGRVVGPFLAGASGDQAEERQVGGDD